MKLKQNEKEQEKVMSKNVVTCINNNMKKYRDEIAIVDGDLRFTYLIFLLFIH